jgi:hypothetical protein
MSIPSLSNLGSVLGTVARALLDDTNFQVDSAIREHKAAGMNIHGTIS